MKVRRWKQDANHIDEWTFVLKEAKVLRGPGGVEVVRVILQTKRFILYISVHSDRGKKEI
jgi:hypothetical protein